MIFNYDGKVSRATFRLEEIAANEEVLGYDESAQMYRDTAEELKDTRIWYRAELNEAFKAVDYGT